MIFIYLGNILIIITKYVSLNDSILTVICNSFINLEIEEDPKVIINYYNK